ncbi:MAG: VWA domain-containing protein [Nanoarchaeota archaeon]
MISLPYRFFETPEFLIFLPFLVFALFFLLRFRFNNTQRQDEQKTRRARTWIFFSRVCILALLIIALATPYHTARQLGKGDGLLTALIDNSTSFSLFDLEQIKEIEESLTAATPLRTVHFGDNEKTPLGDTLLEEFGEQRNILLISDGHNNFGTGISDVLLQATTSNNTIHALVLDPVLSDAAIIVTGPEKVSPGVDNVFTAQISTTENNKEYHVVVDVDGKEVLNKKTTDASIAFTQLFSEGAHRITAQIVTEDHFEENNRYYKTVHVIQKPRILFYSKRDSPLVPLLQQLYEVTTVQDLSPIDKEKYYALIINDIPANDLQQKISFIQDYLSDDNGVLVIGGSQSFDLGNYKESTFEEILPTISAVAEEKDEGIVNVVISLDISKSVGASYGQGNVEDVEKAIAISAVQNLKDEHNVGVVAFNSQAYIVQPLTPVKGNKELIIGKIASLVRSGNTYVPSGLAQAISMVDAAGGAKNILFITDGKSGGMGEARSLAADGKNRGITIHSIGVGDPCVQYDPNKPGECKKWSDASYGVTAVQSVAIASGGTYFHGEETAQQVRLLFGDPNAGETKDSFSLLVKDDTHFITQNLDIGGKITGFNNVIPKNTANLLVTADTGEPLLSVWRYGVGRVAVIGTDDGSIWAGQLLQGKDSLFFTATLNWLIGDPEKKSSTFISIPDTNLGRSTEILVKDAQQPSVAGISFYKKGGDSYSGTFIPSTLGFQKLLNTEYAVNYNKELEGVGISKQLQSITSATGGILYTPETVGAIISQLVTQETRPEESKTYYGWILILAALLLYLVEIAARRIAEHKSI